MFVSEAQSAPVPCPDCPGGMQVSPFPRSRVHSMLRQGMNSSRSPASQWSQARCPCPQRWHKLLLLHGVTRRDEIKSRLAEHVASSTLSSRGWGKGRYPSLPCIYLCPLAAPRVCPAAGFPETLGMAVPRPLLILVARCWIPYCLPHAPLIGGLRPKQLGTPSPSLLAFPRAHSPPPPCNNA